MKDKKKFWIFFTLSLLWVCFIFARSLKPAEDSSAESGDILVLMQLVFPGITMHLVRKLAHFTEFAILGTLVGLTQLQTRRINPTAPLLAGLLCALSDETVQLFISGRSGQVQDVWIDFAGVVAATAVIYICVSLRKKNGTS